MSGLVIFVHGHAGFDHKKLKFLSATSLQAPGALARAYPNAEVVPYLWNSKGSWTAPWATPVKKAKKEGPRLQAYVEQNAGKYDFIDVVGFSLGARVVYHVLGETEQHMVRNLLLFGGAFPARYSWWNVAHNISGSITNFSSRHDGHLLAYQSAILKSGRSIGRPGRGAGHRNKGIHSCLKKVTNIDVTDRVKKHMGYYPIMDELIDRIPDAAREASTTTEPRIPWHNEFVCGDTVKVYTRGRERIRGAKTELVQRALTDPLDGRAPLLTHGDIDGIPGRQTVRAVRAYQQRNGLNVDGIVGPKTWYRLVGLAAHFIDSRTEPLADNRNSTETNEDI